VSYERGVTPKDPALIPAFLRKELEKIQRGIASAGSGGGAVRTGLPITTAVIGSFVTEQGNVLLPVDVAALLTIQMDGPARVRLYASPAAQAADLARPSGRQATAGTGVLAEFLVTVAQTVPCSPVPILSNDEGPPVLKKVYYTIENRNGSARAVTVTLTILPLE
jgi:hypothetical protein